MKKVLTYILQTGDEDRKITINMVNRLCPNGNSTATGVFALTEDKVNRGEIIFDDNMNQWEYTGIGDLTHTEAGVIASFIKLHQAES
jgi:hypothetical protein